MLMLCMLIILYVCIRYYIMIYIIYIGAGPGRIMGKCNVLLLWWMNDGQGLSGSWSSDDIWGVWCRSCGSVSDMVVKTYHNIICGGCIQNTRFLKSILNRTSRWSDFGASLFDTTTWPNRGCDRRNRRPTGPTGRGRRRNWGQSSPPRRDQRHHARRPQKPYLKKRLFRMHPPHIYYNIILTNCTTVLLRYLS